ncbi:AAA family ATPase [Anaerolineales bacterium HSG24]|nr:AAA family ATPase [Anaerolineales bacterium HSG24]
MNVLAASHPMTNPHKKDYYMNSTRNSTLQSIHKIPGITAIGVEGFKSLQQYQSLEIRPFTILAGANSSGKSSILQPLLLLKQTLEAIYDPGPLLLYPTVRSNLWAIVK